MKSKKETIGVFFGSRSPEHDVSIITGQLIISGLRDLQYDVLPVYIGKSGEWFVGEELGSIDFFRDPDRDKKLKKLGGWSLDMSRTGVVALMKGGLAKKEFVIDVAFPAFHGQNGEDGTVQGLFEILNVPYIGCDVASSAMAMDKAITKRIYKEAGMPTTQFIELDKTDWEKDKEKSSARIEREIGYPVFVKPARLGSSIGISKAADRKELEFAVDVAGHYDEKIIVEKSVENLMDITCCVVGCGTPEASLLQESVFKGGFFSYDDKYLKGGGAQLGNAEKQIFIPARLDEKTTEEMRALAVSIFKMFGCSGIARVDFLYDKDSGKFYANEINTLPGTLYHHLWKASGVSFRELLEKLLSCAKERHSSKKDITYTFNSDILNKASAGKLKLKAINE